jgi:ABC-type multidrug transport system ATPase subunit
VLVCSSDAKELALICDRVLVMRDGEVVAEVSRGTQLSEAGLVRAGLGKAKQNGNGNGGSPAKSGAEVSPHA